MGPETSGLRTRQRLHQAEGGPLIDRVELDPVFWSWNDIDAVCKMVANRDRPHRMNRRERMIFRLELEVMRSKRWAKMKRVVDIGVESREDPSPRVVKIVRQKRSRWNARAGPTLEVNDSGRALTGKPLKDLIAHEMIHYYLSDNKVWKGTRKTAFYENALHGRLFRECAAVLIHSRENPVMYRFSCPCGGWVERSGRKQRHRVMCSYCHRWFVSKAEYARLKKMAEVGSKTMPVNIANYVVPKVTRKG